MAVHGIEDKLEVRDAGDDGFPFMTLTMVMKNGERNWKGLSADEARTLGWALIQAADKHEGN
jgi:hypothetical protein